ncbi:MAG: YggS family pyridoxal phosphate-dependent enzyme [Candidatus Sericytochromatia bacterium]
MPTELPQRLAEVAARIQAACQRVSRSPDSARLIVVSKTVPVPRLREALAAGAFLLGENKAQELREKAPQLLETGVQWHFIGQLQTNKIKDILPWTALLHSLDRLELAQKLSTRLVALGRELPVLVQVNTSAEDSKAGVEPAAALELLKRVADLPGLKLQGLMTIGRLGGSELQTRDCFRRLVDLQQAAQNHDLPPLYELSMGMSGDFEWALEEGATLVRVGSAIFGERAVQA